VFHTNNIAENQTKEKEKYTTIEGEKE